MQQISEEGYSPKHKSGQNNKNGDIINNSLNTDNISSKNSNNSMKIISNENKEIVKILYTYMLTFHAENQI